MTGRRRWIIGVAAAAALALSGCTSAAGHTASSAPRHAPTHTAASSPVAPSSSSSSSASASASASASSTAPTSASPTPSTPSAPTHRPVIVIDPGHAPSIHAIDPSTQLNVSDYENEPEMHDVYAVALLVRSALRKAGYRVVMTKTSVDDRVSLGQRAHIANRVHAALAISIHDQAGANGGIGFHSGNNIVYYQSVGTYRTNINGKRIYFTNRHLARISKRYGATFQTQREKVEGESIALQSNVGYNLGSRGLPAGNIWIVQLLSKVPWIYNESGGNSAGQVGLDPHDKHVYARALIAGVEHCVPVPH